MVTVPSDETDEDWRNYIRISGWFSEIDYLILESELDKIYREVPEFRLMLPDIQKSAQGHRDGKVVIRPHTKRFELQRDVGALALNNGVIMIDPQELKDTEYIGTDGKSHPISLTRELLHEFAHLADPAVALLGTLYAQEKRKIQRSKGYWRKRIFQDDSTPNKESARLGWALFMASQEVIEPYAVDKTNQLMHRHYGEPFRDKQYQWVTIEEYFMSKESVIDTHKSGRSGTVHSKEFVALPILDIPDLDNNRSTLVVQAFQKWMDDEKWEEKANQFFDQKMDAGEAKRKEILSEKKAKRNEVKNQRHQSWREKNRGNPDGKNIFDR